MIKNNGTNNKTNPSQLFNFTKDSYLERTARPIYALIFLMPFIIFYELGTLLINTDILNQSQIRVVAFIWLQNALEYIGFGTKLTWAMPALTVIIILIALQLSSRKKWSFITADVIPMTIECIMLAIPLIVLSLLLNSSPNNQKVIARIQPDTIKTQHYNNLQNHSPHLLTLSADTNKKIQIKAKSLLTNLVTSIGAGIYEELIFRLILICLLMIIFQNLFRINRKDSIILSVLLSAALFSAHHHIVFLDGQIEQSAPFKLPEFVFRTLAGVYFAVIFAIRGFGITAGTHAFYDIIAVFINAAFFTP
jgi:hypothetical protein